MIVTVTSRVAPPLTVEQYRVRIREMLARAESVEDAIGFSLGAASACWDNLDGAGEFQSEFASVISEELLDLVRGYVR